MVMGIQHRYRSGELCEEAGSYEFDGYVDGSSDFLPHISEMEVDLQAGDLFPIVPNPKKRDCYWAMREGLAVEYARAFQLAPV